MAFLIRLKICDCYNVNDISKLRINEIDLSVIHLNISSLPLRINELKLFLSFFKYKFDIISISESWITKSNTLVTNIDMPAFQLNPGQEVVYYTSPIKFLINYEMI